MYGRQEEVVKRIFCPKIAEVTGSGKNYVI
jgi:hypothetical protein